LGCGSCYMTTYVSKVTEDDHLRPGIWDQLGLNSKTPSQKRYVCVCIEIGSCFVAQADLEFSM
jgi:hypothetical protein